MYEPHLLQLQAYKVVLARLEKLSPSSQALWGEMNVSQMLAHITANLEMATSKQRVKQMLMGRIFGSRAVRKILITGVQPKSMPTFPHLKISEERDFGVEKEILLHKLEDVYQGGEAKMTRQPHGFFGRLSPNEWARLQYVHIDHHFKQFGV